MMVLFEKILENIIDFPVEFITSVKCLYSE